MKVPTDLEHLKEHVTLGEAGALRALDKTMLRLDTRIQSLQAEHVEADAERDEIVKRIKARAKGAESANASPAEQE